MSIEAIREKEKIIKEIENNATGIRCVFGINNKAVLEGKIVTEIETRVGTFTNYYNTKVKVYRNSGKVDYFPVSIPDYILDEEKENEIAIGKWIRVTGDVRSYINEKHKEIFLYAKTIEIYDENPKGTKVGDNLIFLEGYTCEEPYFKETKTREVISFQVAVHRNEKTVYKSYIDSDYIPCLAWNNCARWVDTLPIGTKIKIYGRLQSRKFRKKKKPNEEVEVYAVSVMEIKRVY